VILLDGGRALDVAAVDPSWTAPIVETSDRAVEVAFLVPPQQDLAHARISFLTFSREIHFSHERINPPSQRKECITFTVHGLLFRFRFPDIDMYVE